MKLYKQVMAKYYPSGRVTDGLNIFGVATAEAFVELLYSAGKNPTRAALMKAYRTWNQPNPFLLPGNRQKTGAGTAAAPVRADHQVHRRHLPARRRHEVLDLGHLVLATTQLASRMPRGRQAPAPRSCGCQLTSSASACSASGWRACRTSVVTPLSRHAARRSAMRSRLPTSAISSTSASGTAAAASPLRPAR